MDLPRPAGNPGWGRILLLGFLAAVITEAVGNAIYTKDPFGLVDNPAIPVTAAMFGPAIALIVEPVLRLTGRRMAAAGTALVLAPLFFLGLAWLQTSLLHQEINPRDYVTLWIRVANPTALYACVRLRVRAAPPAQGRPG